MSRRSVLRTRPQRERDRKFADSARSQFEATQEEVQPASARDFSMSRENPAISCSSSPSVATGEPRKSPLQVLHEELLPLPSTDGALQLRNRWFAPARVKGLSAVADERCRTDKLDRAIKRRSSRETTMVGRGATLDGRLFLGGTDRRYGAGGETSYQGVKGKSAGAETRRPTIVALKDRFSTGRRKGEGAPKPDRTSRRARGRQDRFAPDGWPCGQS